jgi:hypothetical protein
VRHTQKTVADRAGGHGRLAPLGSERGLPQLDSDGVGLVQRLRGFESRRSRSCSPCSLQIGMTCCPHSDVDDHRLSLMRRMGADRLLGSAYQSRRATEQAIDWITVSA